MSKSTAPYLPVVQTHWSFSDPVAQAERRAARLAQARVTRAKRACQLALGTALFIGLTGHKPQIASVKSPVSKSRLNLDDLL